jgi:hypothetical protein
VEAKLVEELDACELLVTPQRPQPRLMTYTDISRLTYLSCVLKASQLTIHADTGVLL